ncbi:hypothetical protein LX36DRAFT_653207 [Colletotrichum falcatum]|nr:hypothetical protein LX36DRAFT_653207 [Colletotrichum falcatum]
MDPSTVQRAQAAEDFLSVRPWMSPRPFLPLPSRLSRCLYPYLFNATEPWDTNAWFCFIPTAAIISALNYTC